VYREDAFVPSWSHLPSSSSGAELEEEEHVSSVHPESVRLTVVPIYIGTTLGPVGSREQLVLRAGAADAGRNRATLTVRQDGSNGTGLIPRPKASNALIHRIKGPYRHFTILGESKRSRQEQQCHQSS